MSQRRVFDHAPESVPLARRFAGEAILGAPEDVVETVTLLVSELATNCIRHARGGFELAVNQTEHQIKVEATDGSRGQPVVRSPGPSDPTGRGLQIIDMLSSDWGVEPRGDDGKTVWFTVELSSRFAARA